MNRYKQEQSQKMLNERRAIEIHGHLVNAKAKPSRIKIKRDSSYLAEQAQGLFVRKPSQGSMNPTDHQLDKIFRGEL